MKNADVLRELFKRIPDLDMATVMSIAKSLENNNALREAYQKCIDSSDEETLNKMVNELTKDIQNLFNNHARTPK